GNELPAACPLAPQAPKRQRVQPVGFRSAAKGLPANVPSEPSIRRELRLAAGDPLLRDRGNCVARLAAVLPRDPGRVQDASRPAGRVRSTEPRIAATGVGERSLIARGLLVNYASLGVSLLSMLILTPVLLRSLGPGAYG